MEAGVEELMPRLLPVGDWDLAEDFDPTVPPRTPQEYLKRVQIEAARCPDVVVAKIDPRKLKKKQTVNISPKSEDEEGWKKFCLGERVYSEIDTLPNNENIGIDYIKATVTSVLEYLVSWFGEKKFTPELGRWLYALLACLEKPLLPEAHSLIRQLARRCSEVRVLEENKNEEQISALNLIICLVSRYFDQRDLADEPS
ncbi:Gem-associated protein 2 [Pitangus sulphuratus]|nr:Gem-associated protein 2 [Pitangus sulphuratus]